MVNVPPAPVRRREIAEADLPAVVDLLTRGFPGRGRAYWERGLARLGAWPRVEGCPRYGLMLEAGGRAVGVALMLHRAGPDRSVRCNLSSWTVDPAYRPQAALLVAAAVRRPGITYTNVTAAPHTWATVEVQGFRPYAEGHVVVAAALARGRARVRTGPAAWRGLPEAALLADHAAYGCASLVVEAADGAHPFVFLPFRARSGRLPLPLVQLAFCRDMADWARFAGPLGRWLLLRRGAAGVVVDEATAGGPPVIGRSARGRKYFRGPHPPRRGDLSYTERVVFGA